MRHGPRGAGERHHDTVAGLLARAKVPASLAGDPAAEKYSRTVLDDLVKRFEPYPDVADLVAAARAQLTPEPPAEPPAPKAP